MRDCQSPPALAHQSNRTLWLAIGVSLFLHAALLSLHFKFPDASRAFQDKALDIILVNSKSARKPVEAQALAQTNLDGGGNTDENRRAKTPLPPSARQQTGAELEQAAKARAGTGSAAAATAGANAQQDERPAAEPDKEAQPEPSPTLSGRDLASSALAMARLEAEISKNVDEYNKRPRKKFIGTRTDEYRFAQYVEDWRLKVERVGTLNYPEAAKGKLYGALVLSVTIKSDGTVDKVEINRTSGHKILDDAARRIVHMAGPYAAFPRRYPARHRHPRDHPHLDLHQQRQRLKRNAEHAMTDDLIATAFSATRSATANRRSSTPPSPGRPAQDIGYEAILAPLDGFAEACTPSSPPAGAVPMSPCRSRKKPSVCATDARRARSKAGAVNTLTFGNEGITGDNTDGAGLVRDLTRQSGLRRRKAGASCCSVPAARRAASSGRCSSTQPAALVIANRTAAKAAALARHFAALGPVHGLRLRRTGRPVLRYRHQCHFGQPGGDVPPLPEGIFAPAAWPTT